MKPSSALIALVLKACATLAELSIKNGIIQGGATPVVRDREVGNDLKPRYSPLPTSCLDGYKHDTRRTLSVSLGERAAQSTLTVRPASDADYFGFCSGFLQPVRATVTTTQRFTSTATITKLAITPVTKTATNLAPCSTLTVLCPIPASNTTCGLSGWGYAVNNIYSATSIDALTCHQLCLKNPACAMWSSNDARGGASTRRGGSSRYLYTTAFLDYSDRVSEWRLLVHSLIGTTNGFYNGNNIYFYHGDDSGYGDVGSNV
ncbi:hypothetical protein G7Y89_g2607 [Cudoniella acicularis]|uniref:Apple domain-containing protein n=1 Tax=Cudoniella acicularis TaxID=354080 RepID=A0A8H4RTU2_9HELO|nr:hypothetical protein G7Y89_g2607 [Cudoniella acicularis]